MNRWTWVAVVALIVVALAGYLTMTRANEPPTGMNDGFEDFKVEEFEATDQDTGDAPDAGGDSDVYDMTDAADGAALPPPAEAADVNNPIPTVEDEDDGGVTDDADGATPAPIPAPTDEEGSAP